MIRRDAHEDISEDTLKLYRLSARRRRLYQRVLGLLWLIATRMEAIADHWFSTASDVVISSAELPLRLTAEHFKMTTATHPYAHRLKSVILPYNSQKKMPHRPPATAILPFTFGSRPTTLHAPQTWRIPWSEALTRLSLLTAIEVDYDVEPLCYRGLWMVIHDEWVFIGRDFRQYNGLAALGYRLRYYPWKHA
jgi:hypothetical protein